MNSFFSTGTEKKSRRDARLTREAEEKEVNMNENLKEMDECCE